MATDKEASCYSCASDPNFAIICSFLDKFSSQCGITFPSFAELQEMLEDTQAVSQVLVDLHVKLLRKARKSFTADKWERALAKFCHTYSQQDGWELERFGYKRARLEVKVKVLKVLLETQFDVNAKFKAEVNKLSPNNLRLEPLGRDQTGLTYWCQFDPSSNVRVYREDLDEESWELVAQDRDGLVQLIDSLSSGEGQQELKNILNEDSTSQEIEKPITDTGQVADDEENAVDDEDGQVDDEGEVDEEEEEENKDLNSNREDKEEPKKPPITVPENDRKMVNGRLTEPVKSNIIENGINHSSDTNESSMSGVDLSVRSEHSRFYHPALQGNFYMMPDRDPMPETADILSQMSARFNEKRIAEDLNCPPKRVKVEQDEKSVLKTEPGDEPIMLIKKTVKSEPSEKPLSLVTEAVLQRVASEESNGSSQPEVGEAIEEPVQLVAGEGNGVDCERAPSMCSIQNTPEPEFSEVIEEPILYVFGLGSGKDCTVGNPRRFTDSSYSKVSDNGLEFTPSRAGLGLSSNESLPSSSLTLCPEFSPAIEEPVQYVRGIGSGFECGVGSPRRRRNDSCEVSSYSCATMGIECSMGSLNLQEHEHSFSEVIEEPIMLIQGSGYGSDCLTGNDDEKTELQAESTSQEKKSKLWSINSICNSSSKETSDTSSGSSEHQSKISSSALTESKSTEVSNTPPVSLLSERDNERSEQLCSDNLASNPLPGSSPGSVSADRPLSNIPASSEIVDKSVVETSVSENSLNSVAAPDEPSDLVVNSLENSEDCTKNSLNDSTSLKPQPNSEGVKHNGPSSEAVGKGSSNNLVENSKENESNETVKGPKNKKNSGRKNVMLTNIIEVCLDKVDNDYVPNSREEGSANYYDLFSAKDLVNPPQASKKAIASKINCLIKENSDKKHFAHNEIGNNESGLKKEVVKSDKEEEAPAVGTNVKVDNFQAEKTEVRKNPENIDETGVEKDPENIDETEVKKGPENFYKAKVEKDPENVNKTEVKKVPENVDKTEVKNVPENVDKTEVKNVPENVDKTEVKKDLENVDETEVKKDLENVDETEVKKDAENVDETEVKKDPENVDKTEVKKDQENVDKREVKEDQENVDKTELTGVKEDPGNVDKSESTEVKKDQENVDKTEVMKDPESVDKTELMKVKKDPENVDKTKLEENMSIKVSREKKIKLKEEEEVKDCPRGKKKDKPENEENECKKMEKNVDEEKSSNDQLLNEKKVDSNDKVSDSDTSKEGNNAEEVKSGPRGRKSRTNSLNDASETEIPNKKPKTEKAEKVPSRRSSRAKSATNTSTEVKKTEKNKGKPKKSESTDEGVKEKYIEKANNEETSAKGKNKIKDKKEAGEKCDDITLSKSSEEAPSEVGPAVGKPTSLKTRKRRSSVRLSKSEEDGDGQQEEVAEEEAGGKKPRLRGKVKRAKGKAAASKPPPPQSSSDEEAEETKNDTSGNVGVKGTLRGKGKAQPPKRRSATKPSLPAAIDSKKRRPSQSKKSEKSEEETAKDNKKKPSPKKAEISQKKGRADVRRRGSDAKKSIDIDLPKKKGKGAEPPKKTKKPPPAPKIPPKKQKKSKDPKADETDDEEEEQQEKEKDDEEEEKNVINEVAKKEKVVSEEEDEGKKNEKREKDSDNEEDNTPKKEEKKPQPKKSRSVKKKTLLGLTEWDLNCTKAAQAMAAADDSGANVRQSRRIAQLKIKEEAERRAIEEATMLSLKDMKKKKKDETKEPSQKSRKKKGKGKKSSDDDEEEEDKTFKEPKEEKRGRKKKDRHLRLKFDENRPWQSSSGSSSDEAEDEEDHFEEEEDEEDIRTKQLVSDHEFSPESDLEKEDDESPAQPVRRARTAKKVPEADIEEEEEEEEKEDDSEDYPCQKCGLANHPEWILLCDKCDSGYHASCLRPPLMLIPEGDWFCPPCQHLDLVSKLKETLRRFERDTKKRENEELRRKRLAYVGISFANVLPTPEKHHYKGGRRQIQSSTEEESEESSEEESYSEDEPVYQLRQRRATTQMNYRFNEYDDLINSAIQDEMDAVKGAGNMGRGKDIQNIVDAEKKENATKDKENDKTTEDKPDEDEEEEEEEEQGENWRPRVVPRISALPSSRRKKVKKLTDLDVSEDDGSDEDFKGSSEEEEPSSTGNDTDDSVAKIPVRRSERTRTARIDRDFINDNSDSSDEPRRKKTKKRFYVTSSSESSGSWGHRKRKPKTYSRIKSSRGKKKISKFFDSDSDRPKKVKPKRPKIRYGLSEDEDEPVKSRTRGKKVSYLDVQGSDTEEEVLRRSRKLPSEDEEEFVPDKDDEEEDERDNAKGGSADESEEGSEEEESSDGEEEEKNVNEKDKNVNKRVKDISEKVREVDQKVNEMIAKEKGLTLKNANSETIEISSSEGLEKPKEDFADEQNTSMKKTSSADPQPPKNPNEPAMVAKPLQQTNSTIMLSEDDEVEEEEIEEEIEEEVEEEEEEEEEDEITENLQDASKETPKLRVVQPMELINRAEQVKAELVRKGVTLSVVKPGAPPAAQPPPLPLPQLPSSISLQSVPRPGPPPPARHFLPQHIPVHMPPTSQHLAAVPPPVSSAPKPLPVTKTEPLEIVKEEKEEKKESTVPAIRLVPPAKLLDPNKARRPVEEGVIRGMLGSGQYYRPPPHPQQQRVGQPVPGVIPPQAGYGRQRYPDQRYSMYPQPTPHQIPPHQYYPPQAGYYQPATAAPSEDYSGGYDEQQTPPSQGPPQQGIPPGGGEEDGVFSGLVSYFSSQREDALDS